MSMEVVNGYVCRNCTDVEYAKKGVDPAHPKDGPDGVYKADKTKEAKADHGPAVSFGGVLADRQQPSPSQAVMPSAYVPGSTVSLKA